MFDLSVERAVASDTMPPPSQVRPVAPPAGYPLELELLEASVRRGVVSLRAALLDAYRLGRNKPKALTSPQEALLRAIGADGQSPAELTRSWGAARNIPVGFRPRVLARTLGALLRLGLVSIVDGRAVLTAAGLVAAAA